MLLTLSSWCFFVTAVWALSFKWREDRRWEAHTLHAFIHLVHLIVLHHLEMVEVHHLKEVGWALVEVRHTMGHHWMLIEPILHLLGHFRLEVAFTLGRVLMTLFFLGLLFNLLSVSLLLDLLVFPLISQVESTCIILVLLSWSLVVVIRADVANGRLVSSEALSLVSIKGFFWL